MSRRWSFSSLFRLAELTARKPRRANTRPARTSRPVLEQLEDRLTPAVSWTGGAGTLNWNDAANWSSGAVPNASQDVVINAAVSGPIAIGGADAVHSLTDTTASLTIASGTLSLAANSSISHDVTLSGGTLSASGTLSIGGVLTQSSGLLTGGGTVTVSGLLTWTGGTMSGVGTTTANGGLQLGASGDTNDSEELAGRTLINAGSAVWFGPATLTQEESSTFQNASGATLAIKDGAKWTLDTGAPDTAGTFNNAGTVTVADGSGSTLVQTFLLNSGSIEISSGTLQLGGAGGGIVSGNIQADSGATLLLGNNENAAAYHFQSGSSLSGAGTVEFGSGGAADFASGATYNVTGATLIDTSGVTGDNVTFFSGSSVKAVGALTIEAGVLTFSTGSAITIASLNQSGGALTGSDTLTVSGLTTWTGGEMDGTGTTVVQGGLDLGATDSADHVESLNSRTLLNPATANWVGSGEIDLQTGSTFVNQSGATFNEQTNDTIWSDVGTGKSPSGLFDNQGTFVVEGGGQATMESNFDNEGTVDINSGTWEIDGTGGSTGTIDNNGALQLNKFYGIASANITGPGSVTLIDGREVGPAAVSGGGDLIIPTSSVSFFQEDGNVSVSSLNISNGWLTVTGTLTVTGSFTWTGGYIAGPGTVIAEGGIQLGDGTSETEVLYGATLINEGTLTVADQDVFAQGVGSTVVNESSGTIDITGDSTWTGDNTDTLDNQGTFEKTAGSGTTLIYANTFVNTGSVAVSSGTLNFESFGPQSGSFTAENASTLELGTYSWSFNSGASFGGAGTVDFTTADNPNSADFLSGSTYDVTGATQVDSFAVNFLSGSSVEDLGALTLSDVAYANLSTGSAVSAASVNEEGGVLTGSDTLTVSGLTTWTGGTMSGTGTTVAQGGLQLGATGDTSDVEVLATRTLDAAGGGTLISQDTFQQGFGSTFQIPSGTTWNVQGKTSWQSIGDGSATIDNQGDLIVAAGSDTATISGGSGIVPLIDNNDIIEVNTGALDLDCDGIGTGEFMADVNTTLQFDGDFTLLSGAEIDGAGLVEIPGGDVTVSSGATFDVGGTTTIDGGTLEIDGSGSTATLNLSDGSLTGPGTFAVSGTTTWTGGTMSGSGTTDAQGSLSIGLAGDSNDAETLDGRTLTNDDAATWAGGGSFSQIDGSTFVNESGASFTIENDLNWVSDASTTTLENAGTLVKSAGSGTTTIEAPLDNTGSVKAEAATLSLQGGGTVGGAYLVQSGATLEFGNDDVTTTSVTLPSDFTAGAINWDGTFSGTATDNSGSGLASVGVSLFDGTHYWDGTAFESASQIFNNAALSGNAWTYAILTGNFTQDTAYAIASDATDNDHGSESSSIASFLLSPSAPVVTSVSPAAGSTTGGATVTIAGFGLANATQVKFGNKSASIVSDSDTVLKVTAPSGSSGAVVDVTVTTAYGTSATSAADQFTYAAPPTVSSVSPSAGVTNGGTSVTIKGTNLGAAATTVVDFGSGNPAKIVSDDGSTIVATSPAESAGPVDVTVTTVGGTSSTSASDVFNYKAPVQPSFTTLNSDIFIAGQNNTFTVTTTGFPAAALTPSGGALPLNVSFVDNGDGTATISGKPALTTGAYTFNITANNTYTTPVLQVFTLTVVDPPLITSVAHTTFTVGTAGTFTITTTPGLPAATKLSDTGTLPSGVTFTDKGNGTATLSGTPGKATGGTYNITITASNGVSSATTQPFTLTVDQAPAFTNAASTTDTTGQSGSFTIATTGFPTAALNETGSLPSGVSFTDNGDGTATLKGTPGAGTGKAYTLTLSASNGVSPAASQTFTLTVDQPPTISSVGAATFQTGKSGSFTITTTGFPTATVTHTGTLPSGVIFTSNTNGTAVISGTPAAGTGGTYNITINATNGVSPPASQLFTLTVNQPPTFSSAAATTFTAGKSGTFTVSTKGFPIAALNESGSLPSGLTFTDNGDGTATLTGTPAAGTGKVYSLMLSAANSVSPSASQTFTLTVDQPPTITSANNTTFIAGKAGSFTVTTTGQVPTTTTLSKTGTLPSGVTFTDKGNGTAVISGTPAAGTGGTYTITINATNGIATAPSQSFTLTVDQAPTISSAASTAFVVGQTSTFTVSTKGFPIAALNESGSLPSGVTFTDNGDGTATLTGKPDAGTGKAYTLTLSAGNGVSPAASQTFTLTVDQPPTISSGNNTTFTVGKAGSFTVTTGAGFPALPITLKLGGTPPSGVTLTDKGNGTATLGGTPAAGTGGSYNLTITASNAPSSQVTQSFTLNVNQPPAVTSAKAATFTVGQSGTFTVTTSGFPAPSLSESGALPAGVTFLDNSNGTATISGTPQAGTGQNYTLTIKANSSQGSITQTYTLTVNQPPIITSAATVTFTKGVSNSFTITTSGFPVAKFTVTGTPPTGVTFVDNKNGTATLSGKPTTSGTFTFTIDVSNGVSPDAVQLFELIVS